jgi:amidase
MHAPATHLHYLTLTELAERIRAGAISPVVAVRAQLDRIAALDSALNSYALVMGDTAIAEAKQTETEIAAGRYRGPLHGVPVAVKDLFWIKGSPTAGGMAIHRDYRPPEDATVVRRLRAAGAIVLGKLQMTEGAYSDHHPSIVPPKNPWHADYWPGISSSGSGVAVAAGLAYGALSSDTGGSIRWPSAANGITGLKPTWGRVSRHGAFELAASLDHIGPMARSAADIAVLLRAIAGSDAKDPTALRDPVSDYPAEATDGVQGVRIGIDTAWNVDGVAAEVQAVLIAALEALRALDANIVTVQCPDVTQAVVDWFPNCAVEAAVAHEATYPKCRSEYGPTLASVIEAGRALSGTEYQKILLRCMDLRGRFAALFETIDLLLTPVQPMPPPTLATMQRLGTEPELGLRMLRFTCPFDMTGHPTITLPGGFSTSGLPIGFQLIAGHQSEAMLLRAGVAFQSVTTWHRHHPIP